MLKQGTRVLITGGAGFIGSHLARALVAMGAQVRVLDDLSSGRRERLEGIAGIELLQADVRNPVAVQRAMHGAEAVVHLAGVQPGVDAVRAQEVNLGGALHILNAARPLDKRARPRVVLCGSASVYGKQSSFVLHEELTPRPSTPEAVMALAMEHYGHVYRETYGVPVVNLRLFRVFGPDEDASRSDAGLVARFICAALDGKSPVIYGDGQQTRDLVYIDNVVAAMLAALTVADPPAEPLNIASGEAVAINFLWTLVLELCGKRRLAIDPTYVPAPPWDPRHTRPQIARACKVLGWAPSVRLREGLARTVEHYRTLRAADPNAWFAPRAEPGARGKVTFPPLQVPMRRFGSTVTPVFGSAAGDATPPPLPAGASPRRQAEAASRHEAARHEAARHEATPPPLPATAPSRRATPGWPPPRRASAAQTLPSWPAPFGRAAEREEILEVADADVVEEPAANGRAPFGRDRGDGRIAGRDEAACAGRRLNGRDDSAEGRRLNGRDDSAEGRRLNGRDDSAEGRRLNGRDDSVDDRRLTGRDDSAGESRRLTGRDDSVEGRRVNGRDDSVDDRRADGHDEDEIEWVPVPAVPGLSG